MLLSPQLYWRLSLLVFFCSLAVSMAQRPQPTPTPNSEQTTVRQVERSLQRFFGDLNERFPTEKKVDSHRGARSTPTATTAPPQTTPQPSPTQRRQLTERQRTSTNPREPSAASRSTHQTTKVPQSGSVTSSENQSNLPTNQHNGTEQTAQVDSGHEAAHTQSPTQQPAAESPLVEATNTFAQEKSPTIEVTSQTSETEMVGVPAIVGDQDGQLSWSAGSDSNDSTKAPADPQQAHQHFLTQGQSSGWASSSEASKTTEAARVQTSVNDQETGTNSTQTLTDSAQTPSEDAVTVSTLPTSELIEYELLPVAVKKIIDTAIEVTSKNLPYRFGGNTPEYGGLDCSGFVQYVLTQAGIPNVPRQSDQQYVWVRRNAQIYTVMSDRLSSFEFDELRPGDLLFWSGTYTPGQEREFQITHSMIYLGRRKSDGKPLMAGASSGRTYDGIPRHGSSVFDFVLPRRAQGREAQSGSRFVGYGPVPGIWQPGEREKITRIK